ncbi:hypothetical protein LX32DRAFT_628926 [Colletotrichum zoysiae]|uniref:AA1-like domain-containing protein n=1 Tax=Colletotrichum zoysiae TaxID=1216348 RepID=A0AAD9H5S6_9PEZI|nr:hypothetical protein LX32DRAFT_628926 [Colletotrichum zoysiae]
MRYQAVLALWATTGAVAIPLDTNPNVRNIHVTLHFFKGENTSSSILAYNNDRSEVINHSCSSRISFGELSIDFIVNQYGAGNITVGEKVFRVLDDSELSGGVTCGRIHNDAETVVNCELTIPAASNVTPINRFHRKREVLSIDQHPKLPREPALAERQMSPKTVRVGDGNPHQNPLNIQLGEAMQCRKSDGCVVAKSSSRSFTVGWSASATAWGWLTAGFAVEMSTETGNSYECPGEAHDFFALWKSQAQTAYSVRNFQSTDALCGAVNKADTTPFVMWSPNSNNRGGYYYCVYGKQYVRHQGARWLDTKPIVGGPR